MFLAQLCNVPLILSMKQSPNNITYLIKYGIIVMRYKYLLENKKGMLYLVDHNLNVYWLLNDCIINLKRSIIDLNNQSQYKVLKSFE